MNVKALIGYAAPYRFSFAIASALMLLESAASLAVPWFGGKFAGGLLADGQVGVEAVLLVLLGLFAIQALLKFANGYILARTSEHILADLRIRVYDHLQALPVDFYHARRKGDILALVTYEVAELSDYLTRTLVSLIPLLVTAGSAVVLMFFIEPMLAAIAVVLIPLFYLLLKIMGRRLRPLAIELQQAHAAAVATAEENLGMLPAIKAFTREEIESERYRQQVHHVRHLTTTQQRISAALEPTVQFIAAGAVLGLLWLASGRVSDGDMTPAQLVSFLLYGALLTRPISALAGVYGKTQRTRGALERLQSVLSERPEPLYGGGCVLSRVRGEIEFRQVSFAYPARPTVVQDVNLLIQAGETVAITGDNGVGKSTLAHLLMRLHDPSAGQILIDGIDVATIGLTSLRNQIGIVPQHVLLLNGSVRDNIGYGRCEAIPAVIKRAAKLAQAHEFIMRLPDGYDTIIGDQGVKLSGGQRQRIALARALLKDPPILILDEATAMFDIAGEASLISACADLFAERTVLLITHRPALLSLADRIVVIDNGRILVDRQRNRAEAEETA